MDLKSVIIVIPCSVLNEYVFECLRGCLSLDYEDYRIVLLPDAAGELPPEFSSDRLVVMPSGDVTIAAKRNMAIRAFPDAGYFAFIDSDAYPRRDWLSNAVTAFDAGDIWAVGGPGITPPDESVLQKAVGNAVQSVLVSGNHAFSKAVTESRFCSSLHSCNLIVPAGVVHVVGEFDEGLRTGEDQEFCRRMRKKGGRIRFDSSVVVYHHSRGFGTHLFMQRVIQGYSIYDIARRDMGWQGIVLFVPLILAVTVCAGFFLGFAYSNARIFSACLVGLYLLKAGADAVIKSDRVVEAPLTFMAIILANCGYVTGSFLGLWRIKLDFKKMYYNYRAGSRRGA